MSDNMLTIISEKFENGNNGDEVEGLTIIVDGTLKKMFDKLINEKGYSDYNEIIRDVVFKGINEIISEK